MYARTYKGLLFYEVSWDGIPCMRFLKKENNFIQFNSMDYKMFGDWKPSNDVWKLSFAKSIRNYGVYNEVKPKVYHKHDLRKYIDVPLRNILLAENLKMFETAYKEGWLHHYKDYAFNKKGITAQEMWGLPNMSNADIHKLKTWLDEYSLREYQDYHETAYKARGKHLKPSQYFIKTWRQAHNRDNLILNKIAQEQREQAKKLLEKYKKNWYKETDAILIKHCSKKEEVVELGRELQNCVGSYDPKKIYVFSLPKTNAKIAVEFDKNKVWQARGIQNLSVPKKIIKIIERKINESRKIKTNKSR